MAFGRIAIVIIGASGDLARRKLIPALSEIHRASNNDEAFIVIGSGRSAFTDDEFRGRFAVNDEFRRHLYYHQGIAGLKKFISDKGFFQRIIFFFALPPFVYADTAAELVTEGFGSESSLIIEKPFGYDYDSARALNSVLNRLFNERQIFRIDHYLAKEAVQNILVFRFANPLFYPVWNNQCIESIQINAFEEETVGERAAYFDTSGIIRDMVQNHLMQLLCLLTMEAPVSLDAEEIRTQKINVLKSLQIVDCCRYQYRGYRQERGVNPESTTETYAMMKLSINNFRWAGVPVYIRTGKALGRKGTEIGVRFKQTPHILYNENGDIAANVVIFKIQPSEAIIIGLAGKIPGSGLQITNTNMSFCYRDLFKSQIPEAYQRLLLDAIKGDRTLFVSAEETEIAWQKLEPYLDRGPVGFYESGSPPSPCWNVDWIPFENYRDICG